jgi:hypothetical protein
MAHATYSERLQFKEQILSSQTTEIHLPLNDEARSADVTGKFTPGVYKTTPMYAYRRRITAGHSELAFNTVWIPPNYWKYRSLVGPLGAAGFTSIAGQISVRSHPDIEAHKRAVLLKAYGKVGAADLELGVEFGELRETIAMLKSPLKALREALLNKRTLSLLPKILAYEGGRKRLTKKALSAMPDTWLEVRYGILPMVRSIYNILETMQGGLTKLNVNRIYTARSSSICNLQWNPEAEWTYTTLRLRKSGEVSCNITLRAYVHYMFNQVPTINDLLGVSANYLPEIAWELTSLSFVLDWFSTIGDCIAAHRWRPYITILGNCVSVTADGSGQIVSEIMDPYWQGKIVPATYTHSEFNRWVNVPVPTLPSLRPEISLGWSQIVDLVLLTRQRLP